MTPEDRDALCGYIREIADQIELRDWTFSLADHPDEDHETGARIDVTYGRKQAAITLGPDWETFPPEERRQHVVHELIHCHLMPIQWTVNSVQTSLGLTAFEVLNGCLKDNIELATDAIAGALAKHFPLPPNPAADKEAA